MWRRLFVVSALMTSVAACAPATTNSMARDPLEGEILQHDASVLLQPEMAEAQVINAYDAISRLRPQFLRRRGETSFNMRSLTQTNVYLDNNWLGGLDILRLTSLNGIRSIRYLNAAEATFRWGINNTGGAILLSTR